MDAIRVCENPGMPYAHNGSVELYYETMGSPSDPPMLLVMGLGAQMIVWPDGFCQGLADRGYFVIRHDNRDVGLSSTTPGPVPDVIALMGAAFAGQPVSGTPYTLSEMAADSMAVLDALGIERSHIMGASMGGMIVQTIAIEHPARVASMTSIMSTPHVTIGPAEPSAMEALMMAPPTSRDEAVEQGIKATRLFSGPLFDEDKAAMMAAASYDRSFRPVGAAFQIAAIMASPDRTPLLRSVDAPTLVVHGRVDPLITLPGGEATAAAVPGASLLVLDEMGHDLPEPLWPTVFDAVDALSARSA